MPVHWRQNASLTVPPMTSAGAAKTELSTHRICKHFFIGVCFFLFIFFSVGQGCIVFWGYWLYLYNHVHIFIYNVGSRLVWWFWLIKSLGKIILNPAIDLMVLINKKFVPGESQMSHTNSLSCSCHAPTTTTTTTTTPLLPPPHQLKNIIWILISRGYGLLKSLAQIIQFLHIVLGVRFIRKFGPGNFQI